MNSIYRPGSGTMAWREIYIRIRKGEGDPGSTIFYTQGAFEVYN